jgi:ferredoxin-NADP reductase
LRFCGGLAHTNEATTSRQVFCIVPNYSILKFALEHHPTMRHTIIYSNKHWSDVIFRDALAALEREHPERLKVSTR